VVFADKLLLNKIDLVTPEVLADVEKRLRGINKIADIIKCQNAEVPLEQVLGIGAFDLERIMEAEPAFLSEEVTPTPLQNPAPDSDPPHEHHHHDGHQHKKGQEHQHDASVTSVGIQREGTLDLEKINSWLSTLLREKGQDIFRCKGVLSVEGMDAKFVFQGVHMTFQGEPQQPWKPDETRVNKLIFIGKKLNREELVASFQSCIVSAA